MLAKLTKGKIGMSKSDRLSTFPQFHFILMKELFNI